jgi:hypothetical protein
MKDRRKRMTNQIRVDISDLHLLTVECGNCRTAATFDLCNVAVTPPTECPFCGAKMERQAHAVTAFRNLYQDLRHSSTPMFFRVAEGERRER